MPRLPVGLLRGQRMPQHLWGLCLRLPQDITADRGGMLYMADRVTGNILRVDPKAPVPVVVARIEARDLQGRRVNADPSGLAFDAQGNLFVAAGPFAEVVRVRAADLNPAKPGLAAWPSTVATAPGWQ